MTKIAVLEAIIIASIMLSAVAYVATFDQGGATKVDAERILSVRAKDFLRTAEDLPTPEKCRGRTLLESYLVEGANAESESWRSRRDRYFGPSADVSMYLHNGHTLYPLHNDRDFRGITTDVLIQPKWDFSFAAALAEADGLSAQDISAAPIVDGTLLRLKGDLLQFEITGKSGILPTTWLASGTTALLSGAPDDERARSVMWMPDSQQALSYQLHAWQLLPNPLTSQTPDVELPLRLHPLVDMLPKGLHAEVKLAKGWEISSVNAPGWTISVGEGDLSMVSKDSLPAPTDILLRLRPPASPTHPFDVFHARLSNGSFAESSLVVKYPAPVERDLPRQVFATTPYPVVPGSRAFFGVAFANGGEEVTVTRVDVEVPGGYDLARHDGKGAKLFARDPDVDAHRAPGSVEGGAWVWVDERHLQWRGKHKVGALESAWWGVEALITSDASQATSVEPPRSHGVTSNLSFGNGYWHESGLWGGSPGILRHRVPADSGAGDGHPAGLGTHGFGVDVRGAHARVRGEGEYSVALGADALRVQNGLANSSFRVGERVAPLGSLVRADADLQSLVTTLAASQVTDVEVSVDLYAPPSLGCKPTRTWSRPAGTMPGADVRALRMWDPQGAGAPDAFLIAGDHRAYRVTPAGAPAWEVALPALPTAMEVADFGAGGGRAVLVGDNAGALHRLDPLTGATAWAWRDASAGAGAVVGVVVDEAAGRAVVASQRELAVVTHDGATAARWLALDGDFHDARLSEDGDVLVMNGSRLERHDASLVLVARHEADVAAHAAAPDRVAVGVEDKLYFLDPLTLQPTGVEVGLPSPVRLLQAVDLGSDGDVDWVAATADGTLHLVDGATLGVVAFNPVALAAPPGVRTPLGLLDHMTMECHPDLVRAGLQTYRSEAECSVTMSSRASEAEPHLLDAQPDGVLYAFARRGTASLAFVEPDGRRHWVQWGETARLPTALTAARPVAGWDQVAVGHSDGTLELRRADTGATTSSTRVTDFVGQFSFYMQVPEGGFFGTHLLVATLSWTDVDGEARHARMVDWFEVVGPDGKPVQRPMYRVVLVLQDRGDPIAPSGR